MKKFGKRRIQHALRPETLLQADGCAEDAAVDADILAEHDDPGVILHRAGERQVDGFDQRHLRHRSLPSSSRAARHRPSAAWRRGDRTWSRGLAAHSQIALDRCLDVLLALGGKLFLLRLAPHLLASQK